MNLYGFAGGDPVNFSDPFGLCPEPASCVLALASGGSNLVLASANAAARVVTTAAAYTVYKSITAGMAYFGMTKDIDRRGGEHRRGLGIEIEPLLTNLSKADAHAVEEVLIVARGLKKDGGDLLNQMHSISPKRKDYQELVARGNELLAKAKLDPTKQ